MSTSSAYWACTTVARVGNRYQQYVADTIHVAIYIMVDPVVATVTCGNMVVEKVKQTEGVDMTVDTDKVNIVYTCVEIGS